MLVLDGVVDLTVDVLDYYAEGARAHDDALESAMNACTAVEACALDADGDALAAYDGCGRDARRCPGRIRLPDAGRHRRAAHVPVG